MQTEVKTLCQIFSEISGIDEAIPKNRLKMTAPMFPFKSRWARKNRQKKKNFKRNKYIIIDIKY